MEITGVKIKTMNVSKYSNWMFMFTETDEGITGLGECTMDGGESGVRKCAAALENTVRGRDPLSLEIDWPDAPESMAWAAAWSAFDMCLWDIKGKARGVPVRRLLAEQYRSEVRMYATFNRALKTRSTEEFALFASRLAAQGFTGLKCAPFDGYTWQDASPESEKLLDRGAERFHAMRFAVGWDVEIRVDNHWRFDYRSAMLAADKIREDAPYWFEAPVSESNGALAARVRRDCGLRIAGGEMQYTKKGYDELFSHDALDVYMFDPRYCGGISGMLRLSKRAAEMGRAVSPHNMSGPVAAAACLQACSAISSLDSLECHVAESSTAAELSGLDMSLHGGCVRIPEAPGLGVELDMTVIEANPEKETVKFRPNMLGA